MNDEPNANTPHTTARVHRQKVIHAVLVMVGASLFVQHVVPAEFFEVALVATAPFHFIGMLVILKNGVEPTAKWLAAKRRPEELEHDWD